jgi:CRISPR-associated endonuclease/helicase Cas3
LLQHSRDVAAAARLLFGSSSSPTPLGHAWLNFFGLGESGKFWDSLQAAAFLHDIGKANNGFQNMIRGNGEQQWRHEILAALLLGGDNTSRSWLASAFPSADEAAILGAILSHHTKAKPNRLSDPISQGPLGVHLLLGDSDVQTAFAESLRALTISPVSIPVVPTNLSANTFWDREEVIKRAAEFDRYAEFLRHDLRKPAHDQRRRLILATKAALIAADAAGSAAFREGIDVAPWLEGCFQGQPLTADWLDEHVIRPAIAEVEHKSGKPYREQDFQTAAARLGDRALLLAPCGAGKTLAAWLWIRERLRHTPRRRAIFLYPTRATATEGFRDYAAWAGAEAALVHGTSAYDLAGMFSNPEDPRAEAADAADPRLFALGWWPRRVFSATVDTFLSFLAHRYASLCLLPVLADSVVVVDEVHSFDNSMFRALESFLRFFKIPVLAMTATLPQDRLRVLTETCELEAFPKPDCQFSDLERLAKAPRYQVSVSEQRREIQTRALAALSSGQRAMLVFNTVARCQEAARELAAALVANHIKAQVLCYHSRFRLKDRKARHDTVISSFRNATGPLALVTTQVCEMSLDLDADFLATEAAPFPSLVQRMGRCCRKWTPGRTGHVLVVPPPSGASRPYEQVEIEQSLQVLTHLSANGNPISQHALAVALEGLAVGSPIAEKGYCAFLDSGLYAFAADDAFRDGDDFTAEAVLDDDINEWLSLRAEGSPEADGLVLPVPRKSARADQQRLGPFLKTAPAAQYSLNFGFQQET